MSAFRVPFENSATQLEHQCRETADVEDFGGSLAWVCGVRLDVYADRVFAFLLPRFDSFQLFHLSVGGKV
jgi:hypothetical protein